MPGNDILKMQSPRLQVLKELIAKKGAPNPAQMEILATMKPISLRMMLAFLSAPPSLRVQLADLTAMYASPSDQPSR